MIRSERHIPQGFAEVILDRPDKRNALTPDMLADFVRALDGIRPDCGGSVRALVVRGEGTVFCAGFDLSLCAQSSEPLRDMLTGLSAAVRALRRFPVPVVIAAHGAAIAGGCALLGGGDMVLTDHQAKLGYPVTILGISPAVSAPSLQRLVHGRAGRERLLDPGLISGERAAQVGLAHRSLLIPEDVIPQAQIQAQQFAEKPPMSLMRTKAWLNEVDGSDRDDQFDAALDASLALVGGDEERRMLGAWLNRQNDKGTQNKRSDRA